MNATLFLILLFLVTCRAGVSQTFEEWFKQKKTQKKYMLLQIAKLQVYMDYVKKGYQIVEGGFGLLGDITQRDFSLHDGYFRHLKAVSPNVKKYSRVPVIIAVQLQILKTSQSALSRWRQENILTNSNIDECQQIMNVLLDEALLDISFLQTVLTDGNLGMSDEERVTQIDQIYFSINHKKDVLNSFIFTVDGTVRQRQQSSKDIDDLLQLMKS